VPFRMRPVLNGGTLSGRQPLQIQMRINVTGNAASGKTTLASFLGAELGLPVFSLDSIVWRPGWNKTPREERLAAERELVRPASWVIDGVSTYVRSHADLVLFLDVPRRLCAWRGLVRAMRYFNRTRPGLPYPCPDIQIVPRLLALIHRFPQHAGAEILRESAASPERFQIERHPIRAQRIIRAISSVRARQGS
jgi:adenylate kinase family enzyme